MPPQEESGQSKLIQTAWQLATCKTPLSRHQIFAFQKLLEQDRDAKLLATEKREDDGATLLHCAIQHRHFSLARRFIGLNGSLIGNTVDLETGLPIALEDKQAIDPNAQDSRGDTPLHALALLGNDSFDHQTLKALLAAGASFDVKNLDGQTPLEVIRDLLPTQTYNLIKQYPALISMFKALASKKALDDDILLNIATAIITESYSEKTEKLLLQDFKKLLAMQPNLNVLSTFRDHNYGASLVHWAINKKHHAIAEYLMTLKRGGTLVFDPNAQDDKGDTPMHYLFRYCFNQETLDTLLGAQADITIREKKSGRSPLDLAIARYEKPLLSEKPLSGIELEHLPKIIDSLAQRYSTHLHKIVQETPIEELAQTLEPLLSKPHISFLLPLNEKGQSLLMSLRERLGATDTIETAETPAERALITLQNAFNKVFQQALASEDISSLENVRIAGAINLGHKDEIQNTWLHYCRNARTAAWLLEQRPELATEKNKPGNNPAHIIAARWKKTMPTEGATDRYKTLIKFYYNDPRTKHFFDEQNDKGKRPADLYEAVAEAILEKEDVEVAQITNISKSPNTLFKEPLKTPTSEQEDAEKRREERSETTPPADIGTGRDKTPADFF